MKSNQTPHSTPQQGNWLPLAAQPCRCEELCGLTDFFVKTMQVCLDCKQICQLLPFVFLANIAAQRLFAVV